MLNRTRRRRGGATIIAIGIAAVILLFGMFFLDMLAMFDAHYNIGVRAQRGLNSLVEYAMDDSMRWDGYNYLDEKVARDHWKEFMDDSLDVDSRGNHYANGKLVYSVAYGTPTIYAGSKYRDAEMSIKITVSLRSGLARYLGQNGYTWTSTYRATNFRTDDNYRRGD